MTGKNFRIEAEIVEGKCPTCSEFTTLVGLSKQFYRCMNCGSDLQQHINGKITYLPILSCPEDKTAFVKQWEDG